MTKVFNQTIHYFLGNALVMLSGIITLVIFTRVFSAEEYGILTLVVTTLTISTVISSCGLPQSSVRFYWPAYYNKDGLNLSTFYSTQFLGALGSGIIVASILELFALFSPISLFGHQFSSIMRIVALTVFLSTLIDVLQSFLRAEQNTKAFNLSMVIRKYSSLAFSIVFVFFFKEISTVSLLDIS